MGSRASSWCASSSLSTRSLIARPRPQRLPTEFMPKQPHVACCPGVIRPKGILMVVGDYSAGRPGDKLSLSLLTDAYTALMSCDNRYHRSKDGCSALIGCE